jgi:response regulator RpfG family c-di-GMP phosphodiesterase
MKVLIVDDDNDIRDIIEFTFNCEVESEFLHADSGNKAIEVIKDNSDISLVICDYNMPDGSGGDVYKYLLDAKNALPYVFCSSELSTDHDEFDDTTNLIGEITKPYIFEGVQKIIKNYNEGHGEANQFNKNEDAYSSVSLELLLRCKVLPCDLYVQLKGGKILKMLNTGDLFTTEEFDKYKDKGLEHLMILREESQDFIISVCNKIEDILKDETKTKELKVLDAHSIIMSTVSELGLSEKVIRATSSSVDFALDLFQQSKGFKKLEDHIFGHPGKYLTTHSVALSYIAVALLTNTAWDKPETRNKMVLAGFLHDASIRVPEFSESIFGDQLHLLTVKDHPTEVQEILKKLKTIPPDLDRILLEHHERPDGSGFPRSLDGKQIHALSSVFILAHDIVDCIFKLQLDGKELSEKNIQELLEVGDYTIGNFEKSYEAFLKTKIFG